MKSSERIATEAQEQKALFEWAEVQQGKYPELALIFAIPNGGSRNIIEAVHLVQQGVRKGVPDLCLPVARGAYHGLFVELKRRKGGVVSVYQRVWLNALRDQGYAAEVCNGWEETAEVILRYLDAKNTA